MNNQINCLIVVLCVLGISVPILAHENGHLPTASTSQVYGQFSIDDRGLGSLPLSHTNFQNKSDDFQFAIISDRTGGHRTPVFHQALQKLNLLQPEFVVSVGDMIEGYTDDKQLLEQQWQNFNQMLGDLDAPYFYTPGNHDFSNDVMADLWRKKYGADYYHVIYNDVLFLMLNTESQLLGVTKPGLDEEQYAYIEHVIKDNPSVRWTLIFLHQPLWKFSHDTNWQRVETLLQGRPYTAFAGHMHSYDYQTGRDGNDHITMGSTGGTSLLRGSTYGEFDHVAWITMKEDGPVIANIALDGIFDKYITSSEFDGLFDNHKLLDKETWYFDDLLVLGRQESIYTLHLSNPFSQPLDYSLLIEANPSIQVKNRVQKGQIIPGEKRVIDLKLSLSDLKVESDLERIDPLSITLSSEYPLQVLKTVAWDENFKIKPLRRFNAYHSKDQIIFDGNISEWEELSYGFGGKTSGGKDDLVRFDVRYDDHYLYLAAKVIDSTVTETAPTGFHKATSDMIYMFIDGRPNELSAHQTGTTKSLKKGEWLFLGVSPNKQEGNVVYKDLMPNGFSAKSAINKDGYSAELRVPLSFIEKHYGGQWNSFRINVSKIDVDATRDSVRFHDWQPKWEENVIGTGTFFRKD